jgi:hypothetical protein
MKKIIRLLLPSWLHPGAVADRHLKRLLKEAMVVSGPFNGMRYIPRAFGSAHIPKLLGSYESELHPWFREIAQYSFDTVIDVGAAEGYYAVGLARLFPNARVVAFEEETAARSMLIELAGINGVDTRLEIRGICNVGDMDSLPPEGRFLVLMDVEGAEIELLDPRTGIMKNAIILFESHHGRDVIQSKILDPFSQTHTWRRVSSRPRTHMDLKHLNGLVRWWIRKVCSSWTGERPCLQDWFLLTPK